MDDGQHAIHPIYRKKQDEDDVARGENQAKCGKKQDKTHAHASHIAGKTFSAPAEVKEREHAIRDGRAIQQAVVYKPPLPVGQPEGEQHRKAVAGRDAIDAVHKVIGIDGADDDNECGGQHIPRQLKSPQLENHQQHRREVHGQAQAVRQRKHVIQEANHRNGGEAREKPRIGKTRPTEPSQRSEVENHAATADSDNRMAAALIGFIDDVVPVGNAEVE